MPDGPIPGFCFDIDGFTWHRKGDRCKYCGFGMPVAAADGGPE